MTPKKIIDDYIVIRSKIIELVSRTIGNSTIQFFHDSKKNIPIASGSGILLEIGNKAFVITAAHVIAEYFKDKYIIIGNRGLFLGGKLYSVVVPISGIRSDDKIDIAVFDLEQSVIEEIKTQYRFLSLSDLEVGHIKNESNQYLFMGYPTTKTKARKTAISDLVMSLPFIYDSTIHPKFNYKKYGFTKSNHLALRYDGEIKTVQNPIPHLAPNLEGVSGCGLWHLPNFLSVDYNFERKLVGIVIERINDVGNKAILASSIDIITEFLRNEIGVIEIPKSNTLNLRSRIK